MSTTRTLRATDPATGAILPGEFACADAAAVAAAAAAAAAAFRLFARSPAATRAQLLRGIATGIEQLGEPLIERARAETALPAARLLSERGRTCTQLRQFAQLAESGAWTDEHLDPADPARTPLPRPQLRSRLLPLGPVAVFGASNFPLAFSVAGGDTAAALAVGCPVIVKAHAAHPGTSQLVADVIRHELEKVRLPAGVFALLFDDGYAVGTALVRNSLIKACAFTGSRAGGLALAQAAQQRHEPIPFFAEMGSVNPVFIFPRAADEDIAGGLHASMTVGVGQMCTQPGLIFLTEGEWSQRLLARLAGLVGATAPGVLLSAGIRRSYLEAVAARRALAGVRTLSHAQSADPHTVGAALLATDAEHFLNTGALQEEIFGPASLAVLCRSEGDFVRCAQALEGQLTASIWADPPQLEAAAELVWLLEQKAGRLVLNGFPTGVELGGAIVHGGPFPATTDSRYSSVGTSAIYRFVRPVAWQTRPGESFGVE
jgi:alpha-ketoglutaric semialdehyde dehydrogenase